MLISIYNATFLLRDVAFDFSIHFINIYEKKQKHARLANFTAKYC